MFLHVIAKGALRAVLVAMKDNSMFAREVFLAVLQMLPSVPRVPGAAVFYELASKMVPASVELILIRNGKVYCTYRSDNFFTGFHLPGTYREPRASLLDDCQRCASKELGEAVRITGVRKVGAEEHPESLRFHDVGMLILCEFEGEPRGGEWIDSPECLIEVHKKYWPIVEVCLKKTVSKVILSLLDEGLAREGAGSLPTLLAKGWTARCFVHRAVSQKIC